MIILTVRWIGSFAIRGPQGSARRSDESLLIMVDLLVIRNLNARYSFDGAARITLLTKVLKQSCTLHEPYMFPHYRRVFCQSGCNPLPINAADTTVIQFRFAVLGHSIIPSSVSFKNSFIPSSRCTCFCSFPIASFISSSACPCSSWCTASLRGVDRSHATPISFSGSPLPISFLVLFCSPERPPRPLGSIPFLVCLRTALTIQRDSAG
jgi:hypothetical protein